MIFYKRAHYLKYSESLSFLTNKTEPVLQYFSGIPHENYIFHNSFWNIARDLEDTKVEELCKKDKWEF